MLLMNSFSIFFKHFLYILSTNCGNRGLPLLYTNPLDLRCSGISLYIQNFPLNSSITLIISQQYSLTPLIKESLISTIISSSIKHLLCGVDEKIKGVNKDKIAIASPLLLIAEAEWETSSSLYCNPA